VKFFSRVFLVENDNSSPAGLDCLKVVPMKLLTDFRENEDIGWTVRRALPEQVAERAAARASRGNVQR
jgi:hypothetical protein